MTNYYKNINIQKNQEVDHHNYMIWILNINYGNDNTHSKHEH